MAIRPSHQRCPRSQARVSNPSAVSFSNVRSSPSERPVPRQSCTSTAKPASRAGSTGSARDNGSA